MGLLWNTSLTCGRQGFHPCGSTTPVTSIPVQSQVKLGVVRVEFLSDAIIKLNSEGERHAQGKG